MEEETRPGSSHLPTLQTDKVDLYKANKPIHFCSERMRRRRRKVCRSTMSAVSPISLLAGSTPPCGKPSGYPLTSENCLQGFLAQVGLVPTDLFDITGPDDAARNAKRFERIWEEEKQRCENSSQKPSLSRSFLSLKFLFLIQQIEKLFSLNCFLSFQPKEIS